MFMMSVFISRLSQNRQGSMHSGGVSYVSNRATGTRLLRFLMNTSNAENGTNQPKSRKDKWRHAFAWGPEYDEKVSEEDEIILDAFAKAIVKRHMTAPALLWFVSLKPLNLIGASILQAAEFLFKDFAFEAYIQNHFMPAFEHAAFVRAIEKRKGIDRLIELIELRENESSSRGKKRGEGGTEPRP